MARPLQRKMKRQKAVYWPPATPSFDEYGRPKNTVAPCEVCCRWVEMVETSVTVEATVYTRIAVVHPDIVVQRGGFMFEGPMTDLVDVTDPKANKAREIVAVTVTPDLSNRTELVRVVVGDG